MFFGVFSDVFQTGLSLTLLLIGAAFAVNIIFGAARLLPHGTANHPEEQGNNDGQVVHQGVSTQEQGLVVRELETDTATTNPEEGLTWDEIQERRPLTYDEIQLKWADGRPIGPVVPVEYMRAWENRHKEQEAKDRWMANIKQSLARERATRAFAENQDSSKEQGIADQKQESIAAPEQRTITYEEPVTPSRRPLNVPVDSPVSEQLKSLALVDRNKSVMVVAQPLHDPFTSSETNQATYTNKHDKQELDTKYSEPTQQPNTTNGQLHDRDTQPKQDEHVRKRRRAERSSTDEEEQAATFLSNRVERVATGQIPVDQSTTVASIDSTADACHNSIALAQDDKLQQQIGSTVDGASASVEAQQATEPPATILQHPDVKLFGTIALVPLLTPSDDTEGGCCTCGAWALSGALADALWPTEPTTLVKKQRQLAVYKYILPMFDSDELKQWASNHYEVTSFSDLDPFVQAHFLSHDTSDPGLGKDFSVTQLNVVVNLLHTRFGSVGFPKYQLVVAQLNGTLDRDATSTPDDTRYTFYPAGGYDAQKPILWLRNIGEYHWEPCVRNILPEETADISMNGHAILVGKLPPDDPRASSHKPTSELEGVWPWDVQTGVPSIAAQSTSSSVTVPSTFTAWQAKHLTPRPDPVLELLPVLDHINTNKRDRGAEHEADEEKTEEEHRAVPAYTPCPSNANTRGREDEDDDEETEEGRMEVDPKVYDTTRMICMQSPKSMHKKLLCQKYHLEFDKLQPPPKFSFTPPSFDIEPSVVDTIQEQNEVLSVPLDPVVGKPPLNLQVDSAVQLHVEGTVRKRRLRERYPVPRMMQISVDDEFGWITRTVHWPKRLRLIP